MRRNVRERVAALAPFLTFDPDPYMVVGDDGRLSWIMDAFTTSDRYPYSRHYRLGTRRRQLPAQQRQGRSIDAYDGTTTFYVFDPKDPIIDAYRAHVSVALQGCRGDAGRTCASTSAIRSCCSRCRRRSTACTT